MDEPICDCMSEAGKPLNVGLANPKDPGVPDGE